MSSPADKASRYRRLQRFFAEVTIDFEMIASFIFRLFFVTNGCWYLTMDRTNWKWGKADINILTLGIAFKLTSRSKIMNKIPSMNDPMHLILSFAYPSYL